MIALRTPLPCTVLSKGHPEGLCTRSPFRMQLVEALFAGARLSLGHRHKQSGHLQKAVVSSLLNREQGSPAPSSAIPGPTLVSWLFAPLRQGGGLTNSRAVAAPMRSMGTKSPRHWRGLCQHFKPFPSAKGEKLIRRSADQLCVCDTQ